MARSRNIKPGFFKNEDIAECSLAARLCFIGLWGLADREGRLEDRPKRIKAELFAFDALEVEPLLVELDRFGFIQRYQVDGASFIQISKFRDHQTPHFTEKPSVIKPPNSETFAPSSGMDSKNPAPSSAVDSRNSGASIGGDSRNLSASSAPDSKTTLGVDPPSSALDSKTTLGTGPPSSAPDFESATEISVADPASRGGQYPLIPSSLIPSSLIPSPLNPKSAHTARATLAVVTPGQACKAMRALGMARVSPSNPLLAELIAAGASVAEFEDATQVAVAKEKGFAYALAVVKGKRQDAAHDAAGLHVGPMPRGNGNGRAEPQWATEKRERIAALGGDAVNRKYGKKPTDSNTIDMETDDGDGIKRLG